MRMADGVDVSLIIPLLNEEGSLVELHERITAQMALLDIERYEIVFVNDGSSDGSEAILRALHARDRHVHVIHFRRNFGKAAAIDAGFRHSKGVTVITMDADLQDDPAEIGTMLEVLDGGYDLVSGWKKTRHDPLAKTLPSKLFNFTLRRLSGLPLHDFNCGFKAYRREAAMAINVYGELHRYIPVLVHWKGFKVTEVAVEHHPRRHGTTKYGLERILKGFLDCLTVLLLTRFASRPLHLFGTVGAGIGTIGATILAYLSVLWVFFNESIGDRPILLLGIMLMLVGVQLVSSGLVAEMLTRQDSTARRDYNIREVQAANATLAVLEGAGSAGGDGDDEDAAFVGQARLEERVAR
jgi:glycosyltransferase involved in cell wall biosynthesis